MRVMRVLVVSEETADRLKAEEPTAMEVPVRSSIEELVLKLMPAVPRVPDAGWTEQARRNAELRALFLGKFRTLDAAEVGKLSGSKASNPRALASRWAGAGRIFGVPLGAQVLYPEFQFDETGQPRPAVAKVLVVLKPLGLSPWAGALWWDTGSDVLGWRAPAEVLPQDPDAVVAAAQADARTLGR
jgi:hypothetical protein